MDKFKLKAIFFAKQAIAINSVLFKLQKHCDERTTFEYSDFFKENIKTYPHCKFRHLLSAKYVKFKKLSMKCYYNDKYADENNISIEEIAALNIA